MASPRFFSLISQDSSVIKKIIKSELKKLYQESTAETKIETTQQIQDRKANLVALRKFIIKFNFSRVFIANSGNKDYVDRALKLSPTEKQLREIINSGKLLKLYQTVELDLAELIQRFPGIKKSVEEKKPDDGIPPKDLIIATKVAADRLSTIAEKIGLYTPEEMKRERGKFHAEINRPEFPVNLTIIKVTNLLCSLEEQCYNFSQEYLNENSKKENFSVAGSLSSLFYRSVGSSAAKIETAAKQFMPQDSDEKNKKPRDTYCSALRRCFGC